MLSREWSKGRSVCHDPWSLSKHPLGWPCSASPGLDPAIDFYRQSLALEGRLGVAHADRKPLISRKSGALKGRATAPGDKSISHRALILGALAVGETRISGLL